VGEEDIHSQVLLRLDAHSTKALARQAFAPCTVYNAVLRIRDVLSRIPDPTIAPSRIRILDPGGKKAPDPGSGIKASRIRGVKKQH
jgi:hypothetical protein